MGLRRTARECALQMLYQRDIGGQEREEILDSYWRTHAYPEKVREFANHLFEGCLARLAEIDRLIQSRAKNWRLRRMAAVDRNILRLAVFELTSEDRTPSTVVINEALEIAKKFSTHESAQFVNGVLDSIRKDLHPEEAH
ncbi:MAG: transcription antitermination factor NusB [Acidobacteria bacterium]|nr:transcription antitermination factor NusB [Acidobacteriota bacterium]